MDVHRYEPGRSAMSAPAGIVGARRIRVPRPRFRASRRALALRWLTVIALLGLYEILARLLAAKSSFVAAPSEIVTRGVDVFSSESTVQALRVTAGEFVLAFVIAAVAGVLLAAVLGSRKQTLLFSRDVLQILFAMPQVAVYPLFILFLGIGQQSKIAFGVTHGIFPIVLTTMSGIRNLKPGLSEAVRAMGGGRVDVLVKAVLPAIAPDVITGLRVGASLTLVGVLLGELMASSGGIGAQLTTLASAFQPAELYAVVAAICLFAILVNTLMRMVELRMNRWRG